MSIFSRGHYYDNCLVSVDQEWSVYGDPDLKVVFMAGPFKLEYNGPQIYFRESFKSELEQFSKTVAKDYNDLLEYNGPQKYFRESFKSELERFSKKVAKDYNDYFHITDRHTDCFEAMIEDFETLDCPYWNGGV